MGIRLNVFVFWMFSTVVTAFAGDPIPGGSGDDRKPLYEIGCGVMSFYLPDYPGSSGSRNHILPFPYLTYRGRFLRSSREEGIRGRLFRESLTEIDLSAGGAFPADSEKNRLRRGMPDLDWMGELGPRLMVYLKRSPTALVRLDIPFRGVFSTDTSRLAHRGYLLQPGFHVEYEPQLGGLWFCEGRLGLMFGSRGLNAYFYEVPEIFETPERQAFRAREGYMGAFASGSIDYRLSSCFTVVTWVRVDIHDRSVNRSSPLFDSSFTVSFSAGFIWSAYQSKNREEDSQDPTFFHLQAKPGGGTS